MYSFEFTGLIPVQISFSAMHCSYVCCILNVLWEVWGRELFVTFGTWLTVGVLPTLARGGNTPGFFMLAWNALFNNAGTSLDFEVFSFAGKYFYLWWFVRSVVKYLVALWSFLQCWLQELLFRRCIYRWRLHCALMASRHQILWYSATDFRPESSLHFQEGGRISDLVRTRIPSLHDQFQK